MSDIVRFRMLRSPDRVPPVEDDLVRPTDTTFLDALAAAPFESRSSLVASASAQLITKPSDLKTPLPKLDEALSRAGNRLDPRDVEKVIDTKAATLVNTPQYSEDRTRLMNTLGAVVALRESRLETLSTVSEQGPAVVLPERVHRLLLVCGLLELLARKPSPIDGEDDVFAALRWRTVVLPGGLTVPSSASTPMAATAYVVPATQSPLHNTSRRPAFADLYVVRQDWVRYEPGEVAHIENVMRGESKEREHTRRIETEITTFMEDERHEYEERDSQTTDRFELSTEASREMELALHLEGSVDAKTLSGPTTIQAHVGGSVDFSQATADRTASRTSREAVERAVTSIETRVRSERTSRLLTAIEEINRHALNNEGEPDHAIGIYRWVNKINRLQVYRYPNRFLLEFQIPEPAAWWRWNLSKKESMKLDPPVPFTVNGLETGERLRVTDVTETTYASLGARYRARALPAAPPPILKIGAVLTMPSATADTTPVDFQVHDKVVVPDGYRAVHWSAQVLTWHNGGFKNQGGQVQIAVGGGNTQGVGIAKWSSLVAGLAANLPDLTGTVPISVMTDAVWGFGLTFTITCHRLEAHLRAWQQSAYDMIADAYSQLQLEHDAAQSSASVEEGVSIEGSNPQRNRQIVFAELKKQVITLLAGTSLVGVDALTSGTDQEPSIDLAKMRALAPIVGFMEQAFEWENLTYFLYPYYWAARSRWRELSQIEGADPDLAAFLSAGSVRVIVPARPGQEQAVNFFLHTGLPWMGVQAPAPNDPGYLSIDAEIRALQQGASQGTAVGDPWEVRMPTDLVHLQSGADLPTNPAPTVP